MPRRAGHRSTIPFRRIHRPDWLPRRFEVFHAISAAIAIRIFIRIFSDTVQKIFRRMENMGKTFTPDLNSQFFDIGQRLSKRVGVVFETGFSDGESGQRYSEYSVFHSRFFGIELPIWGEIRCFAALIKAKNRAFRRVRKPSIVLSVTSVGQANAISCSPLLWRNSNHVSILGAMHLFVSEKSFPGRHEKVIAFSYCAGVYWIGSPYCKALYPLRQYNKFDAFLRS